MRPLRTTRGTIGDDDNTSQTCDRLRAYDPPSQQRGSTSSVLKTPADPTHAPEHDPYGIVRELVVQEAQRNKSKMFLREHGA